MQRIVPNIWCNRNAEEAAAFYASAFENVHYEIEGRYPEEGLLDFQREFAGEPLTIDLTISGYRFTLINAGDEFHPNPSLSFMLNFDPLLFDGAEPGGSGPDTAEERARASLDRLWERLGEGGTPLMPLGEYPFSAHFGWMQDRFGVSWQLMLTDPAGDPRPFILPALMFGGPAQNRAAEAVDHYLAAFSGGSFGTCALGNRALYTEAFGPVVPGSVQFSDFRIGDQWFVAMDAGMEQDFSFDCGVSLLVHCKDQAEIDRLWERLSAVPEAEQCGWLADRFGVSWQIVPENMEELMQRPHAFEHMLEMKKLVIADF